MLGIVTSSHGGCYCLKVSLVPSRSEAGVSHSVRLRSMVLSLLGIRTSVMETFKTGNSIKKAPAYLDQMQGQEIKKINYLISTEMVNDVVLLRVDEVNIRAC